MAKNTSVTLGEHFNNYVESKVEEGRYGSVSEVIRAALRLLEEHDTKLLAVRAAVVDGLHSGPGEPLSFKTFGMEARRRRKNG